MVFRRDRPPNNLRCRVHPLVCFVRLQSSVSRSPARTLSLRAPSLGSRPSSRHQHVESTHRQVSHNLFYVPSTAFRTLSTACSSSYLARLFHRAAVSRVLAPGVCSHDPAAHLVGETYPRVVGDAAYRLPGASERRVDLRVSFRTVIRGVERRVTSRATRSPPAFSAPSGFGDRTSGTPSRPLRSRSSRHGTACPPRR